MFLIAYAQDYYEPWDRAPGGGIEVIGEAEPSLSLEVRPSKTSFVLGDEGMITATLTRGGSGGTRGMILVEIGVPPGFRLTPEAMSQLSSSYPVRRVERLPRGVALYLEDPGVGVFSFQMPIVALRGVHQVWLPRSRAYFYYQPQIEAQANPILFTVTSPRLQ